MWFVICSQLSYLSILDIFYNCKISYELNVFNNNWQNLSNKNYSTYKLNFLDKSFMYLFFQSAILQLVDCQVAAMDIRGHGTLIFNYNNL